MPTVTIKQAQAHLPERIQHLNIGDELVITENNLPVARLARTEPKQLWPCRAGSAKGRVRMAADFDAPLPDFVEYSE
jgi:antitoxin (DNA-binding transcriptional repressor) of toxin-antitoxin stability system